MCWENAPLVTFSGKCQLILFGQVTSLEKSVYSGMCHRPVELPYVHVAHMNALLNLSIRGILHFKLTTFNFCCFLLGEIIFIASKRHYGLVNPVVGEGGPAVVHHASVVMVLL